MGRKAKKRIKWLSKITYEQNKREGNSFSYTIYNAFALQIDTINTSAVLEIPLFKKNGSTYDIIVKIPDERNYLVHLIDHEKPDSVNTIKIGVGDFLDPELRVDEAGIEISF